MKGAKFYLTTLAVAIFATLWPHLAFAEIEKVVEKANGQLSLKVGDTGQTFPLKGQTDKLEGFLGKEVKVVGKVEFDKKPPPLVVESIEKG